MKTILSDSLLIARYFEYCAIPKIHQCFFVDCFLSRYKNHHFPPIHKLAKDYLYTYWYAKRLAEYLEKTFCLFCRRENLEQAFRDKLTSINGQYVDIFNDRLIKIIKERRKEVVV